MPKGSIKSWRRDRGFGFINVDGQDDDVFVHISELRDLGRPPRIGDEINFSIETQENGKIRAVNCTVKDNNTDTSKAKNIATIQNNKAIAIGIAAVVIVLGIIIYLIAS